MTAETHSVTKLVVAFDFSELAERAVHEALKQATSGGHYEVHVICVGAFEGVSFRLPGSEEPDQLEVATELVRSRIGQLVDGFQEKHGAVPVDKVAVYVLAGHVAERVVALAQAIDADLVIVGTHSRKGVRRLLLGSVAEEVARTAPCGVLVLRPRDFLDGAQLPAVAPPLKEGEHALAPFEHAPVYHYVSRAGASASRVMPIG